MKRIIKEHLLSFDFVEDNIWLDAYINLIVDNLDNGKSLETQKHHIIPRHFFKLKNLEVDNSKNNLVNLSFSNHIKAHVYLALASKSIECKMRNIYALKRMGLKNAEKLDADKELLEKLELAYAQYVQVNQRRHLGTHHDVSETTRKKISESNKGRYEGHAYIHLGDEEKRVPKNLIPKYLEKGWTVGRSGRTRKALSAGYNYSSKGMLGKHQSDYQKELCRKLNSHPASAETKRNMSIAKKGKKLMSNDITKDSLFVEKDNIESYLKNGYHLGKLRP